MDRMLRVAHVVPYYPPHSGGMERAAADLVAELPAFGVAPQVITSDVGSAGTVAPQQPGVLRLPTREFAHTPLIRGLAGAVRRLPAGTVVHVHVAQAFVPDVAAAVARRRGLPVVAHYHLDVDPTGLVGRLLLRPYQRTLLRHTLRRADLILVPTPDYATIVTATFGVDPRRVQVLPNGTAIDLAPAPRVPPSEAGLAEAGLAEVAPSSRVWRLLSVGRLNDQKNHALLLEACAELRRLAPQLRWTLDICGEGELRPALETAIARLGLSDAVRLLGEGFTTGQMQRIYAEADVFVLASRKESFGIVYVEAMAQALPIVTTDVPGTRNVVRHEGNGLLAAQNAGALAAAIVRLTGDGELYRRLSANGLQDAAGYRWPDVARRLAGLYRILSPQASPASSPSPASEPSATA